MTEEKTVIGRRYKDTLFRMIFNDKKELLSLYNALNHSDYDDENQLQINTLGDSFYMHVKNDVSFIFNSEISIVEHQSTVNPNMPLRDLMYISRLFETYVDTNNLDVYSSRMIRIPAPRFVVLYNGERKQPDISEMKLSDMYEVESDWLELKVIQYNINAGANQELLDACKSLGDYAKLIAKVRENIQNYSKEKAVEIAIEYCIENNILREFLQRNRTEAGMGILNNFNEELHNKTLRDEGREEAFREIVILNLRKGRSPEEIAEFTGESIKIIKEIESEMLVEA